MAEDFTRILVVDDEPEINDLLARCLEKEGLACRVAANGYECFKMLRRDNFDLMLTDIKMLGIDGIDLIRRVKNIYPDLRIGVISAVPKKNIMDEILAMGVRDFIQKPFDLDEVIHRIHDLLPYGRIPKDRKFQTTERDKIPGQVKKVRRAANNNPAGLLYKLYYKILFWYRRELRPHFLFYQLLLLLFVAIIVGSFLIRESMIHSSETGVKEPGVYELLKRGVESIEEYNRVDRRRR